jgi:hypothetical protein
VLEKVLAPVARAEDVVAVSAEASSTVAVPGT